TGAEGGPGNKCPRTPLTRCLSPLRRRPTPFGRTRLFGFGRLSLPAGAPTARSAALPLRSGHPLVPTQAADLNLPRPGATMGRVAAPAVVVVQASGGGGGRGRGTLRPPRPHGFHGFFRPAEGEGVCRFRATWSIGSGSRACRDRAPGATSSSKSRSRGR